MGGGVHSLSCMAVVMWSGGAEAWGPNNWSGGTISANRATSTPKRFKREKHSLRSDENYQVL